MRTLLLFLMMWSPTIIDPNLQPDNFFNRYTAVVEVEVTALNPEGKSTLVIKNSFKSLPGNLPDAMKQHFLPGAEVNLDFSDEVREDIHNPEAPDSIHVGKKFIALVGRQLRGPKQTEIMLYTGFGSWWRGNMKGLGQWTVETSDAAKGTLDIHGNPVLNLAGTWNGSIEQLSLMMADLSASNSHFPRFAYTEFHRDDLIDEFESLVDAVALRDIDGDHDLDIIACTETGNRVYLQMKPMEFVNATEWLGIEGTSFSVDTADVNNDGFIDILFDGQLWLASRENGQPRFIPDVNLDDERLFKTAQFIEVNGDGRPDVIATTWGEGIRVYTQTTDGWQNETEQRGLSERNAGSLEEGFVAIGDWNHDGRSDLFLSAADGFLLTQDENGRFIPIDHGIDFNFTFREEDADGLSGAGFFAPILDHDQLDLILPIESGWHVVANKDATPVDITHYGNEISEGSYRHKVSVGADFNCDGTIDFYTACLKDHQHNRLIINRGYGSFMLAETHKVGEVLFPGPSHRAGANAVACGDIDQDGAPDLLIANRLGALVIVRNNTPAVLANVAPGGADGHLAKAGRLLLRGEIASGLTGAEITLRSPDGNFVRRFPLQQNGASGSASAAEIAMGLRQPGEWQISCRWGDGHVSDHQATITSGQVTKLTISR